MSKSSFFFSLLVFFSSVSIKGDIKELTILYTNDLHSHLVPHKESWLSEDRLVGGFANIATLVKQEKTANPEAIYIDAGDYFSGPYVSTLTQGAAVIESMNYLDLDAACIGNHEFDHGWQNTFEQLQKAKFPILNGNIFVEETGELFWNNPYIIIEKEGLKIGIIGLHGKFAFHDTINKEMVVGLDIRDEEVYLKKYIAEIKDQTDLIILSIHEGMPGRQSSIGLSDVERALFKDIDLASKVSDLDIIVTGHAHKGTEEALQSNGTLIVSTNAYTTQLGKLVVSFDTEKQKIIKHSNQLIPVFDDEIPDDPVMLAEIHKWNQRVEEIAGEVIATTSATMTRAYGQESNMGNMFADALKAMDASIDIAVINSGALRQDIVKGEVTIGNLISAFPFPNRGIITTLTGKEVKEIFEHAAGQTNGVLQVSKGFQYSITNDNKLGFMRLNGMDIEPSKTYRVAAPNFVTMGGDGYLSFLESSKTIDSGILMFDIAKNYMQSQKNYQPFFEDRIVLEN
ncbi:MAG: bifunctional UDP-sugar hydrolase/5'-nucleotidase [Gammaproteobacteria bacterium]